MSTFVEQDGTQVDGDIIAIGRTGIIIRRGNRAFKIPRKEDVSPYNETGREYLEISAAISKESPEREKLVYQHLYKQRGIVEVFEFINTGIEMAFMENGDVSDYLKRNPSISQRLD